MNSCHEQGFCDRNRAGIEAADPALRLLRAGSVTSIPVRFRSRTPLLAPSQNLDWFRWAGRVVYRASNVMTNSVGSIWKGE
eukprot:gene26756-biopygen4993